MLFDSSRENNVVFFIYITVGNTTVMPGEILLTLHPLGFVGYSIVLLASLFGNSVIIHIIRTDNSMKTTTNYLIINQACADLLISIAQITGVFYYSSTNSVWIGGIVGLIFCKMYIAVLFISPKFSAWILAIIAIDRFYAVARPLRLSPISQHLKKIIFLCWAWSSAFSMHYIVKETFKNVKGHYYCDLTILFNEWSIFSTISITLNVFTPLSMMTVLYTIVCLKLCSREVPGEGNNQNEEQAAALKIARKVTRMMTIVVVLYLICWLPVYMSVLLYVGSRVQANDSLFIFTNFLTLCYGGMNPYVYLILSQNFRNGFKKLLTKFCGKLRISNFISFRSKSVELKQI